MNMSKQTALRELQTIPAVGKSVAVDLWKLGIHSVKDLKGKDPEKLYLERCSQVGTRIDPCLLYTFRCAVYFASHKRHDPELLKWWNWKDRLSFDQGQNRPAGYRPRFTKRG